MSTRSFRTFAQLGLIAGLLTAFAASWSTPAAAAKQSDVLAACKRTPGCWSQIRGGGDAIGCSPHACFVCVNGKCQQARSSGGGKLPGSGSIAGNVSSASRTTSVKPTTPPRGDIGPVNSGGGGHKH
jgi:hypothetical protein